MEGNKATRRGLLRFFAALPVTAWLLRPDVAAAQASRMVVFNGVQANAPAEGPAAHVWGWAAETPQGWIGRVVDAQVATARRDYPGFAAGVTMVTPKGTSNTINGTMDNDGIRAHSVCFSDVTGAAVAGSFFKLTGVLTQSEAAGAIFNLGDPISVEGNADAGEFTFTIRAAGAGRDAVFNMTGPILMS